MIINNLRLFSNPLRHVSRQDYPDNSSCHWDGLMIERKQESQHMFTCGEEVRVAFISN